MKLYPWSAVRLNPGTGIPTHGAHGSSGRYPGKTVRLTWTEGPTRGVTHEHVFYQDGTVEWHDANGGGKGGAAKERPAYASVEVAEGVYAVSYLASSGYTLTVVLNFRDRKVVGFASSAKDWHLVRGTFEVVS